MGVGGPDASLAASLALGLPLAALPGEFVALGAALVSSVGYVSARRGFDDASPEALVTVTAAVSVAVFAPLVLASGRTRLTPEMVGVFVVSGFVGPGLGRFLLSNAIGSVGAGVAHAVKSASPVVAAVFSVALLGEKVTPLLAAGVVTVVVGLVVLTYSSEESDAASDPKTTALFSLLIVLWFGTTPIIRKFGLSELGAPLLPALAINFFAGMCVGAGIAYRRDPGQLWAVATGETRWYLLLTGACWTVSLSAYFAALSLTDAVVVVPLFNASPLFTVALGALLLGETEAATMRTLVGATVTVAGVVLITVAREERRPRGNGTFIRPHSHRSPMRVAVIGAGNMGHGIAQVAASAGHSVTLNDVDEERVRAGLDGVADNLDGGIERGKVTEAEKAATLDRITGETDLAAAVGDVDLVVEAVPEEMDLKKDVFTDVEAAVGEEAIVATNTSSLSVTELASALEHPERAVGLHFFNPPHIMGLVEVVLAEQTSAAVEAAAVEFVEGVDKEPVVVEDAPGFASSRLGVALGLEAIRMVETGVAGPADIDAAMREGYNHPMGPLELTDVVGLDVRLDIAEYLREELGERFKPPQSLKRKVRAGKLGRKSGEGFYLWEDGEKAGLAGKGDE